MYIVSYCRLFRLDARMPSNINRSLKNGEYSYLNVVHVYLHNNSIELRKNRLKHTIHTNDVDSYKIFYFNNLQWTQSQDENDINDSDYIYVKWDLEKLYNTLKLIDPNIEIFKFIAVRCY
jgi:hypothetical protein